MKNLIFKSLISLFFLILIYKFFYQNNSHQTLDFYKIFREQVEIMAMNGIDNNNFLVYSQRIKVENEDYKQIKPIGNNLNMIVFELLKKGCNDSYMITLGSQFSQYSLFSSKYFGCKSKIFDLKKNRDSVTLSVFKNQLEKNVELNFGSKISNDQEDPLKKLSFNSILQENIHLLIIDLFEDQLFESHLILTELFKERNNVKNILIRGLKKNQMEQLTNLDVVNFDENSETLILRPRLRVDDNEKIQKDIIWITKSNSFMKKSTNK